MDTNRLEEFIVLADCLNYSKAANLLYLTQPVLSRHINDLEESLGAQLFIRDTHRVTLTPFGEIAAREIRGAMDSFGVAMQNIRRAADNVNNRISVGFLGQAVRPFLTRFIQYLGANSAIQVDYTSSPELDNLISLVERDAIDLAFLTHVETDIFRGLEVQWILDDPLCVVVPTGHALAQRESIAIRELSGIPMIAYNKATNPHTAIFHEKLFRRLGSDMNVVQKVSNMESALFNAGLGMGCLIIPKHLTNMVEEGVVVPISDKEAFIPLRLIWKKSNAKTAVRSFVREFSKFYNDAFS